MPGLAPCWCDRAPGTAGTEPQRDPIALPWHNQASGPVLKRGSGWPRRLSGDALATDALRIWKYHLPAGIIQPNYRDNHRCGGEARKNARVFRVIPYLFRRRKRFRGSFPRQGEGSVPKKRGCPCLGVSWQLLTPRTSQLLPRTAWLGRGTPERMGLVHPARKMEREEDGTGHPARPLARYYMSQLI